MRTKESVSGRKKEGKQKKYHSRGRPGRRTKDMVDIAKERVRILLNLAERESIQNMNPDRARRYVTLARKIGMRYNVRIEKYFSNKICRSCNSYLATSHAARVRCRDGRISRICKHCGKITRVPIHKRHLIENSRP